MLGFHGCDESVAREAVLLQSALTPSQNKYDWLGTGIYFWENSPERALEFAKLRKVRLEHSIGKRVEKPAVLGAIIDLGYCLNLLDHRYLQMARESHRSLAEAAELAGIALPKNVTPKGSKDLSLRNLDCAVINAIHEERREHNLRPFDSVRAAFMEGAPLYANSGFCERNHIQICVCNIDSIKGYFFPIGHPFAAAASHSL